MLAEVLNGRSLGDRASISFRRFTWAKRMVPPSSEWLTRFARLLS